VKSREKNIISVPVIYDWVNRTSTIKISIPIKTTYPSILKSEVSYFYAIADGKKRIFTDSDAVTEYGSGKILDPSQVSYSNVFVNGILQSPLNYSIIKGQLQFNTEDVPGKDILITVQFVSIFNIPK
jgi:hypothetical protein